MAGGRTSAAGFEEPRDRLQWRENSREWQARQKNWEKIGFSESANGPTHGSQTSDHRREQCNFSTKLDPAHY